MRNSLHIVIALNNFLCVIVDAVPVNVADNSLSLRLKIKDTAIHGSVNRVQRWKRQSYGHVVEDAPVSNGRRV
ncbi:hypothetical protein KIN20_030929 [Parelaphostrongylus tenuis]|uniref:Secreted protein n=1 Tax=Parelaphostrongylus tenuis TaxID=148309 RepID=A0AAD5R4G0_PARTN|nr:hypothetical protein KIN20_030929 [Parelaphostrongylus tenuis]